MRRLQGAADPRRAPAGQDAARHQAADRPVRLQRRLFLSRGLLFVRRGTDGRTPAQGAGLRTRRPSAAEPALTGIAGTHGVLMTGIGGTGVVTIGAILAQAAAAEGKGAAMLEMAGLARTGGAVQVHCRIAARPAGISAVRVAIGEAN